MSTTYEVLVETMKRHYQVSNLVGISPLEFRTAIFKLMDLRDGEMEGFREESKQRDLSIRFHWGHDHDFGEFRLAGRMGDRHLAIPAEFIDQFKVLPVDLSGKHILDIGVWTGGTSLLLCALGAKVVAIEEVKKYADSVEFLKHAFDVKNLQVLNKSLYDLNDPQFFDQFDHVLLAGVIYHVTDPIVALRIAHNALKDGGTCLIESAATEGDACFLEYHGPSVYRGGSKEDLSRSGWNWFVPSRKALRQMMIDVGFQNVKMGVVENRRVLASAERLTHSDLLRAGLSVRSIR